MASTGAAVVSWFPGRGNTSREARVIALSLGLSLVITAVGWLALTVA